MTNTPTVALPAALIHSPRTLPVTSFQAGVDVAVIALWLGHQNTTSTDVYLHADMSIKQAAIDRTRDPSITPGTYAPPADVLAFLDSL